MAKRGRPKKDGDRYDNGRLKWRKMESDIIAPTLLHRIRTNAEELGLDPKLEHETGRLFLLRRMTAGEASVAHKIAEIYGRAEFYDGRRRVTKSPSYEMGFRSAETRECSNVADDAETSRHTPTDFETRAMAADESFRSLKHEIRITRVADPHIHSDFVYGSRLISAIEQLCVDEEPISPAVLPDVCLVLTALIPYFGTERAPKKGKQKKMTNKITPVRREIKERPLREIDYGMAMLARMRPDLDRDFLLKEWHNFCALRDRDVFRQQRGNDLGVI